MKTKSLLVLSLVGAAAVVGVGAIGVSGIAINSNVEATSSKTMIFNSTTNKPTYPANTPATAIFGNQINYTATTLSSGSFASGTSGVAVSIASTNSGTSGTYYSSSAYWLTVHPQVSGTNSVCNFTIKWGINAVIENAYINFQATNGGLSDATSTVNWTFNDQNGTSHTQAITSGTAFTSLGYKAQSDGSIFSFSATKVGDYAFMISDASFSWSC